MLIEPRVFRWNEKTIEIRSALPEDAKKLKAHREATAAETHFMARYPEDGEIDFGKMRNGIESMRDRPWKLHDGDSSGAGKKEWLRASGTRRF